MKTPRIDNQSMPWAVPFNGRAKRVERSMLLAVPFNGRTKRAERTGAAHGDPGR